MNAWECGSKRNFGAMGGKTKYLGVGGEAKTEQKRREKKMGQMLQTLKHTHKQRAHTRRAEIHIHSTRDLLRSFLPSFVPSFLRPSVPPLWWWAGLGGPPSLPASLPPSPACSGTLITRLHGTCAVPCCSRSHPQVPIKINAFFSFFFPCLLVASIHPSLPPSVHPARP